MTPGMTDNVWYVAYATMGHTIGMDVSAEYAARAVTLTTIGATVSAIDAENSET